MAENSAIEWCDSTFNPWIGCTKVGPGCDHCYAETLSKARLGVPWGQGASRRRTVDSTWAHPRRWERAAAAFFAKHGRRQRVFCASLADVFDNEVPAEWRADLFALIRATPSLDWLFVTKRIGNAAKMAAAAGGWPENVWLGATIVNQAEAERDIPKLAAIDVEVRFLSMEPLLGSVDLSVLMYEPCPNSLDGLMMDASTGAYECCSRCDFTGVGDELAIHWIIVGGESGPGARPANGDWYRDLRDQCAAANVPFLFKQHGEWIDVRDLRRLPGGSGPGFGSFDHRPYDPDHEAVRVGKKAAGRLLDGVQHDGVPA